MTSALVLASVLAIPPGALAGPAGVLTGRVVPLTDSGPIAKTVWVGPVPAAVAADGSFRADGLPGGPAAIAIETSEGLYLVATPVTIAPGALRPVQLTFGGRQDSNAPPAPEPEKKKKRGGVWANPVYATLIVVGSAVVLGVAVDALTTSETTPASPSAP